MVKRKLSMMALALAAVTVVACGGGDKGQANAADSLSRDLELAPAPDDAVLNDAPASPAASTRPAATRPAASRPRSSRPTSSATPAASSVSSLAAGASLAGRTTSEISSRTNKAGETVRATIGTAVKDSEGRVVIPAGSVLVLTIVTIHESENKSDKTGKLTLDATSVEIGGQSYAIDASVGPLATVLRGRKTNAGDVAKVGAGAGIGAVAGRVLGGSTKGAVIGGVIGGAVGAQRANETQDSDVVLPAGAEVEVTLRAPLSR
jgi:hypothetical protein